MLFNSIEFLIFLPIVFFIYWYLLNKNYQYQNIFLLIVSYIFYGWWDWRFLSLIMISSFVDYSIGGKIESNKSQSHRNLLLFVSILVNIGFLFYFKYYNFFIDSFVDLLNQVGLQANRSSLNIVLPVGISFYTFQTLSYTLDIYKKEIKPTKNIIEFFTFVSFFPQLVAGPIERARRLLPQFQQPRQFSYPNASSGSKLIIMGFFKKMVIADSAAVFVDIVYSNPGNYTGLPLVIATFLFSIQIYCDFSGYSDIAIGTAKLFGFNLIQNFNKPYFSNSITEFWNRWHISLSTWFRDYVYIPLGGNRVGRIRVMFNVLLTFCISGLWHGANWTFVIWGLIHGILLILERYIKRQKKRFNYFNFTMPIIIRIIFTYVLVTISWVFFRANNVSDAFFILNNLFIDINHTNYLAIYTKFRGTGLRIENLLILVFFISLLIVIETLEYHKILEKILNKSSMLKWGYYYLLLIFIMFWGTQNSAENFIYFQF